MAEKRKRAKPRKYESFPEKLQRSHKASGASGSFAVQPKEFKFEYTTPGPYCKVDRLKTGRCATQLNFVDGKPVIRLCSKYGEPGEVIEVDSPAEAQEKAKSFCAARPVAGLGETGQQAVDPKPFGTALKIAAGTALGILALKYLFGGPLESKQT